MICKPSPRVDERLVSWAAEKRSHRRLGLVVLGIAGACLLVAGIICGGLAVWVWS